jgi:predicted nucleic acid-binding Zn ribbon protein
MRFPTPPPHPKWSYKEKKDWKEKMIMEEEKRRKQYVIMLFIAYGAFSLLIIVFLVCSFIK